MLLDRLAVLERRFPDAPTGRCTLTIAASGGSIFGTLFQRRGAACFTYFVLLFALLVAGCSSDTPEPAEGETPPLADDPASVNPAGEDPADNEPDPAELSDAERLLNQIKLAAGEPLLSLRAKFASGEALSDDEKKCLGDFDPAVGEAPTNLDCENGLLAGSPFVAVKMAALENSDNCQSSLAAGNLTACKLQQADVQISIEWVSPNQIQALRMAGGLQPIAGAIIKYNLNDGGNLILTEQSNITGTFNCTIAIASAELTGDSNQSFSCKTEVQRISERLAMLRAVNAVARFMR